VCRKTHAEYLVLKLEHVAAVVGLLNNIHAECYYVFSVYFNYKSVVGYAVASFVAVSVR